MVCTRCKQRFNGENSAVCPRCGHSDAVASSGLLKTCMVLISAGKTDAVYHSVQEVPDPLRKKLLKSTNGLNSATILIADRRGREEISRAIRSLPLNARYRLAQSLRGLFKSAASLTDGWLPDGPVLKPLVVRVLGMLLGGAAGVLVWLIFSHKW